MIQTYTIHSFSFVYDSVKLSFASSVFTSLFARVKDSNEVANSFSLSTIDFWCQINSLLYMLPLALFYVYNII